MGRTVEVCVVTGFGINADLELENAFARMGARASRVHFQDLAQDPEYLDRSAIIAFPGGFSFGDHLGSGLVFAARFKSALGERFYRFLHRGGLVIGICNGFQILVKMGILPNLNGSTTPEVSLIHNESGHFQDRWVQVAFDQHTSCVWTRGLTEMEIPIRHGEGRFVASDAVLDELEANHMVALRYAGGNPNGSARNIAGICDASGRILGLMPHPEAFFYPENHPRWTREKIDRAEGLELLRNGVEEASHG